MLVDDVNRRGQERLTASRPGLSDGTEIQATEACFRTGPDKLQYCITQRPVIVSPFLHINCILAHCQLFDHARDTRLAWFSVPRLGATKKGIPQ